MRNQGGISALQGIKYEIQAVVYQIPSLIEGRFNSIRYQPLSSALSSEEEPRSIYCDDFSIMTSNGDKCYYQAKQNTKDNNWTINRLIKEGVIEQLLYQYRQDPNSKMFFLSNIPAQSLSSLNGLASCCISLAEFADNLNPEKENDVKNISRTFNLSFEEIWNIFKNISFELKTESQIEDHLYDFAFCRYNDINKFIIVLKDLIEKSPGKLLTKDDVISFLEKNGLYLISGTLSKDIKTILYEASGALKTYKSTILGLHIDRDETETLKQWIFTEQQHPIAFLLEKAGSGKSVIMHDLLEELESEGVPVLAIKADLLHNFSDSDSLQTKLNLPATPESLLSQAVLGKKAVLLIDQLDALSATFSRNQAFLDAVIQLIGRVSTIPKVSIIISCRSFDRKFDPKLRQISSSQDITIKPLEQLQIQKILTCLKMNWKDLKSREQKILSNPLHLSLFAKVVEERIKRNEEHHSVSTIQELFDELWELIIMNPNSCPPVSSSELQKAIYVLVNEMHNKQELYQNISLLDDAPEVLNYLRSQGLLHQDGNLITFFHQSFYDYCYARRFVQSNTSLYDIVHKGDQGLFVRSQVVQTINYLRGIDNSRYLKELKSLMNGGRVYDWLRQCKMHSEKLKKFEYAIVSCIIGPPIRYHLRHLIFSCFGQQTDLLEQEINLGISCFNNPSDRQLFLDCSQGNAEWYDVLKTQFVNLSSFSDQILDRELIPFLYSIQEEREAEVYGLFCKQLGISEHWNNRIKWCLNGYKEHAPRGWQSEEIKQCVITLCREDPEPWNFLAPALYKLSSINPNFGCILLSIIMNRLYLKWRHNKEQPLINETNKADNGLIPENLTWMNQLINHASSNCPLEYLNVIIPWLEKVLPDLTTLTEKGLLRDALFSLKSRHSAASIIINGFRDSLNKVAGESPNEFISFGERIKKSRYLIFNQVLADVLAKHPARYVQWIYLYLMEGEDKLHIGNNSSTTIYSRKLIASIFPLLTPDDQAKLEDKILSFYPSWENTVDTLCWRGLSQLELLWGVPDNLLTQRGQKKREELRRKFNEYQIYEGSNAWMPFTVGSPIPDTKTKLLSDDAWLNAMRSYDDKTFLGKLRNGSLSGGIIQLSESFERVVQSDPERFIKLAHKFDISISSYYYLSLLNGLSRSTVPSKDLFAVCDLFSLLKPDDIIVQRAICDAVEKRIKDNVPNSIITLIKKFALTAADPDQDNWQLDPHEQGFNSIRGRSVRVYIYCLLEEQQLDIELHINTLEQFARDPSIAVRSCLIEVLPDLLRLNSKKIINIFDIAIDHRLELLESRVSSDFIYHSLTRHSIEMLKHIELMFRTKKDGVKQSCGRLATMCYFYEPKAKALYQRCLKGDIAFRIGVATVLARNVDKPQYIEKCLNGIKALYNDKSLEVHRSIEFVFSDMPSPTAFIKRFIRKYLFSIAIIESAYYIVDYAKRNMVQDYKLAVEIIVRMQQVFSIKRLNNRIPYEDDIINLSMIPLKKPLPTSQ